MQASCNSLLKATALLYSVSTATFSGFGFLLLSLATSNPVGPHCPSLASLNLSHTFVNGPFIKLALITQFEGLTLTETGRDLLGASQEHQGDICAWRAVSLGKTE